MSEQLRALQEERSNLSKLLEHPGFVEYLRILEAQIESRRNSIFLKPLKSMDEALEQEYRKGEIAALLLAKELTAIQLREVNEEIEAILTEAKEN